MKSYVRTSRLANLLLAGIVSIGVSILTGCGMGQIMSPNSTNVTTAGMSGKVHGGPNSIVGAKVVLYATTSTDYGIGAHLADADAPTDADGSFTISSPYTCPSGQYAYVVIYGGNTGGGNNPNSILVAPVSTCDTLTHSTFTYVSELTTIATAYALGNFIKVTGDAAHSNYLVGIGAPATNSATTGCVMDPLNPTTPYYVGCTKTVAAGLAHAFANAFALVSNQTGQANTTTVTGATIPASFLNALGNSLQSCVNSAGGGTDVTSGLPTTTTTTAGGTTFDGTPCGALFAYTSYTTNGNPTDGSPAGTLKAGGDTLSAIMNLAKRPSGSATLFGSTCGTGTTGTTPAATCIFNLGSSIGYYNTPAAMSAPPTDWMLGISYAKGSFSTMSTTTCNGQTANGVIYPFMLATDINDNIVILNADGSSGNCYNLLAIGFDGTSLGGSDFDANTVAPIWVATDSYGHVVVPAVNANQVRIYQYAAGGTSDGGDGAITKVQTITGTAATTMTNGTNTLMAATLPHYLAVDSTGDILVTSYSSVNGGGLGWGAVTQSHTTPSYAGSSPNATLSTKMSVAAFDLNNNGFAMSNALGGAKLYMVYSNGTKTASQGTTHGNTSPGETMYPDSSGTTVWSIANAVSTLMPSSSVLAVDSFTYTPTSIPNNPTLVATPTPIATDPGPGQIDGANVIWFSDHGPSSSYVRGYDTTSNYMTPELIGCKFSDSSTTCGGSSTASVFATTRGIAIDAAGDIWAANGNQGQINEVIGLAAPTWPLYIHNGISNKP